jgi:hypothetical protein
MTITAKEKLQCATRELELRRRVYPRLIGKGRLSQPQAWHEIEAMEAIVEDYRVLAAAEEPQAELFVEMNGGRS